ncbi:unnamed protein product [Acanthosepion pharaonis]|uniref:Uncharacterized protein n=1 Tax=Acanthosepion pharaonis TaxID=158019 RepID=A0A812DG84_ACAPH|nr:unnamed protein product [Sepia pharaonis]
MISIPFLSGFLLSFNLFICIYSICIVCFPFLLFLSRTISFFFRSSSISSFFLFLDYSLSTAHSHSFRFFLFVVFTIFSFFPSFYQLLNFFLVIESISFLSCLARFRCYTFFFIFFTYIFPLASSLSLYLHYPLFSTNHFSPSACLFPEPPS